MAEAQRPSNPWRQRPHLFSLSQKIREAVAVTLEFYASRILLTASKLVLQSALYKRQAAWLRRDMQGALDAEDEFRNAVESLKETERTAELIKEMSRLAYIQLIEPERDLYKQLRELVMHNYSMTRGSPRRRPGGQNRGRNRRR